MTCIFNFQQKISGNFLTWAYGHLDMWTARQVRYTWNAVNWSQIDVEVQSKLLSFYYESQRSLVTNYSPMSKPLHCDHCWPLWPLLTDNGNFGIWVWIGKRASEGERREAMRNAQVAHNIISTTIFMKVIINQQAINGEFPAYTNCPCRWTMFIKSLYLSSQNVFSRVS